MSRVPRATDAAAAEGGDDVFEGGCDCRKVRYRMLGEPLIVHACHCRWCQRETGSAFAINALIEKERLVHLAAEVWSEASLLRRAASSRSVERGK